MSKQYRVQVYKMIEQDVYQSGCVGIISDLGKVFEFASSDLTLVRERILSNLGIDVNQCESFEERLETGRLEDSEGNQPSESYLSNWMKSHPNFLAYNATYSIHLSVSESVDASILKKENVS